MQLSCVAMLLAIIGTPVILGFPQAPSARAAQEAAVPSIPITTDDNLDPITGTDFVTVLDNILTPLGGTGLDPIFRSALTLQTGETVNLNYNGSTYVLTIQSTTTYVSDLDAQVNKLKTQSLQPLLAAFPAGTAPASLVFLNATSITISQMSTTSDLDLSDGTSSTSLKGLLLKPPTVGSNTNFTIPGLFQTLGKTPGVNFTLIGGSDGTNEVKIVVPAGIPQSSSTTSNSATWTNLRDASSLSVVEFRVQPLPNSLLAFLVSPVGIAIEAVVAIAIVVAVVLYLARRSAAKNRLPMTSGLAPSPGLGPGPAPPSP